ncbi:MAG: hypothetical protein ABJE95_08110 [Byssovorax sp.]
MTRAAVLLTGAIALALVARAASIYRGTDPLAFALVLLIGFGLMLGLAELLIRAGQAERLGREIAALPPEATLEIVDASSPSLRGLLRARLVGVNGTSTTAPFTPYLLGLLVMIGMLGTFLGLFETLRGAREALTSSGDVDSLRAGLAAPMVGLSRAFGSSAAGVSASAMLGLGAVFVRRAEAATISALARYVAGPLARLTTAGRQLVALEALADQGRALPEAAAALRDTATRLEKLEAHLLDGQTRSAAEAAAVIKAVAAEVRADLAAGIDRAATSTAAAVQPLLVAAVDRAGTTAGEALSSFTGTVDARLTDEANLRRERDAAHLVAMDALIAERAGAQLDALSAALIAASDALSQREAARAETLGAAMTTVASQSAAFAERVEQTATALTHLEATQATRLDERAERLFTAMSAEATRFETALAARARAADARVGELDSILAEHLRSLGSALTAPIGDVVRAAQAAPEAAAKIVDAARERLEARALADAARDVRLDALTEKLDAAAGRMGDMSGAQATQLAALTERTQTVLDAQASQLAAFELRLEGARTASAEAMAAQLGDHARGVGESLGATATLVQEASLVLRAGGAEMASVAEMFTGAVDRYRAASDRWLENLGAIEDAIARKEGGESADLLGAYLDQTREVFDHSLRFQRELFSELRALRAKGSS